MEILGWTATILSILGILLNSKKNILCWPIWLVSSLMFVIYFIVLKDNPSIILWVAFFGFNAYGWIQWRKDKTKK